jgi:uncharacterized protein YndB with AHSA1/START domain
VALAVAAGWVGLYAYGRTLPTSRVIERSMVVPAPIEEVWAWVGDPARRPEWHPGVRAIAHVEDRGGHAVWREVDAGGDRFDWLVVERQPPRHLVTAAADPEQIGMHARWTWDLADEAGGTRVTLREESRIDNPVWRATYVLRYGPDATVEGELSALRAAVADGRTD